MLALALLNIVQWINYSLSKTIFPLEVVKSEDFRRSFSYSCHTR